MIGWFYNMSALFRISNAEVVFFKVPNDNHFETIIALVLVSLFNSLSTFESYSMLNPSYSLGQVREFIPFPRVELQKFTWLCDWSSNSFTTVCDTIVQHVKHYTTGTLCNYNFKKLFLIQIIYIVKWVQVLLSNTTALYIIIWFQVTITI